MQPFLLDHQDAARRSHSLSIYYFVGGGSFSGSVLCRVWDFGVGLVARWVAVGRSVVRKFQLLYTDETVLCDGVQVPGPVF